MTRPDPPAVELTSGERWIPRRAPGWHVGASSPRCRWGSPVNGYCGRPAVATLLRGHKRRPYAYCELHLYGRWIEGDAVLEWIVDRG